MQNKKKAMRNALLITLIGIMAVSLATMAAVYALPADPPVQTESSKREQSPGEETAPYLLRVYQGKLAVFTTNLAQPDMVYDVYVRTLPEKDKEMLTKGIRVQSFDKLTALIEDYIS